MYFSKPDYKTMAPHDASQGAISSGNRKCFPASAFDFSACDDKEVIMVVVVGGIFLSLLAEFSLGKTPQAAG